jgi:hypothetical protein
MLRLIRRRVAACAETSERKWKCRARDGRSKVACTFYIIGPDPRNPTGPRIKRHTGTCSEQIARARLVEFENGIFNPRPREAPKVTIEEAVLFFLKTRLKRSKERQVRLGQQLGEMVTCLSANFDHHFVTDVKKTDLEDLTLSWQGAYNTLVTRRRHPGRLRLTDRKALRRKA